MGREHQQETELFHSRVMGFGVHVEVNGKRAPIYAFEEDGNKAIAYIEAVEGANFSVHWFDRRTKLDHGYSLRVHLDGTDCGGKFRAKNNISLRRPCDCPSRHGALKGQLDSETTERPFMFGTLQTTDDDDAATTDENLIRNLGTIRALYLRAEAAPPKAADKPLLQYESKIDSATAVHEKNKKAALSHRARLGTSVPVVRVEPISVVTLDSESAPFVCFEFRYRSRQLLQLEGHMPDDAPPFITPPAPVANGATRGSTSDDPGPDGLTRRERIAQLRARLAADSSDDDDEVMPKRVKTEVKVEKRDLEKVKPDSGLTLKKTRERRGERHGDKESVGLDSHPSGSARTDRRARSDSRAASAASTASSRAARRQESTESSHGDPLAVNLRVEPYRDGQKTLAIIALKKLQPELYKAHEIARRAATIRFLRGYPWGDSEELASLIHVSVREGFEAVFEDRDVDERQVAEFSLSLSQRLVTLRSSLGKTIRANVKALFPVLTNLDNEELNRYTAALAKSDDGRYAFLFARWAGPGKRGRNGAFLHPCIPNAIQQTVFSSADDIGFRYNLFAPDTDPEDADEERPEITAPFVAFICTAILHGLRKLQDPKNTKAGGDFSYANYRHHYDIFLRQLQNFVVDKNRADYYSELYQTASTLHQPEAKETRRQPQVWERERASSEEWSD